MKYNVLLIYFLIWLSSLVLCKDIIGIEGIPSHWKRYQKPVNNNNHHKPHYLSNKILGNNLNYETNFQNLNKVISPKAFPSYKMMQPTLSDLLHKKISSNVKADFRSLPSFESDKASDRQNDGYNKAAEDINENSKEVDKRTTRKNTEKTNINANIESTFKSPVNVRGDDSDQKSMDIVHEHRQIPLRQTRQMDSSSYPEKRELRDENFDKKSVVEELQENNKIAKRSEIEKSKTLEEEIGGKEKSLGEEFEDTEQIVQSGRRNNNERTNNIGNIQPMILNPFHDPRGWIRYRFMPNQFALSNRNYINQLYPYTKDKKPFYNLQV